MSDAREILEGTLDQGSEEEITYTLTVPTTWGVPTGTPTVKGYSYADNAYTDVTSTIFPTGSASIASQVITLPECKSMTAGTKYRIEVKFATTDGGVREAYAWIDATR